MTSEYLWPHPIKAIIFDNDGIILDTIPFYYKALTYFADPPFDQKLVDSVNGLSEFEACKVLVRELNINMTLEEFMRKRNNILREELFPNSPTVKGVERLIKKFHEMKLPMAVATSSLRELHNIKISKHKDIYDLIKVTVCGDEVGKAKPSPEIFQVANKKLGGFNPENVLVFEDAFHGIKAANNASMASCFLHPPFENQSEVYKEYDINPSYLISSFDDFDFSKFIWE